VLTVPKPKPSLDEEFLPWEPGPTATSGQAISSLVLGILFVFACLGGVPPILDFGTIRPRTWVGPRGDFG
jgi:hypothetical protein